MTQIREDFREYYEERNPGKRRKLLEEALGRQEDLQRNELRKELWERRYGTSFERKIHTDLADGFLRLWMELKSLAENPPGRFWVRREQRRLREQMEKLGFSEFYERGEPARTLLYLECLHACGMYVHLCFMDRNYSSTVLGMVPMKKNRVQDKILGDLAGVRRNLPGVISLPEPLNLLLQAAGETEEALRERFVEEE